MANRKRVIWRCRRGMKELDVILEPFAEAGLPGIEDQDLACFEAMLESADADLLAWFTGAVLPPEPRFGRMVKQVLAHRLPPVQCHVSAGVRHMEMSEAVNQALAIVEGEIYAPLSEYGLLRVGGPDAAQLLQGQLTADISLIDDSRNSLGAWCTPKGRTLMLGRLFHRNDALYYLLPAEQTGLCLRRLQLYVLRSKVDLDDMSSELTVIGVAGAGTRAYCETELQLHWPESGESTHAGDLTLLGTGGTGLHALLICPASEAAGLTGRLRSHAGARQVSSAAWGLLDIEAGVPWLPPELSEQFLPQMLNLDRLDGVSFEKGCYAGQEIVARTQYLGRLKRRLFKARLRPEAEPRPGDTIYSIADRVSGNGERAAGTVVGAAVDARGGWAVLAVINIEDASRALHLRHVLGAELCIEDLPYPVGDAS